MRLTVSPTLYKAPLNPSVPTWENPLHELPLDILDQLTSKIVCFAEWQ